MRPYKSIGRAGPKPSQSKIAKTQTYRIHFKKPIEAKLVAEFDLLATDLKSESDL